MSSFGLRDIPVEDFDGELLGLREYADSLTEFILRCETPMTIALQGDWGSGKTSLMNLIKKNIESKRDKIETIWFNTWQYSQFGNEDELAVSLLSHFTNALGADRDLKKAIAGMSKRLLKILPAVSGMVAGDIGKEVAEKVKGMLSGQESDVSQQILELKKGIESSVKNKIGDDSKKRLVVFVDDLDRLLPEKAVELLEVFKLFLDVPGCVYVLACDYQVVSQGLKKKFGVGSDDLKGKSFFDKIIQLPFSMPIGQYDVQNYIKSLLKNIEIAYEEDDIQLYADMLNYSVGYNPRGLKRLFNSLLLLNLVASKKKLFEGDASATKGEKQRIMFGTLCLQMAYEPVYRYMQRHPNRIDQNFFESLKDENELKTDMFSELRNELGDTDGTKLRRLSQFAECFFDGIQLRADDDKNSLSKKEVEALKQILSFSALTSTDSSGAAGSSPIERYENREEVKNCAKRLDLDYSDDLKKLGTSFQTYQARNDVTAAVYLPAVNNISHYFWFNNNGMKYSCYCNQKFREESKQWFDNNCSEDFPQREFKNENEFAVLLKKEFDKELPKETKVQQFKEEVSKCLDLVLPKLINSFGKFVQAEQKAI